MDGHQPATGCRLKSGSPPSVRMSTADCTASEMRPKARAGRMLSRMPWSASRLKKTKTEIPPVAAKFAPMTVRAEGSFSQWPAVVIEYSTAHGRFMASTNVANRSAMAVNLAKKIWRALKGRPARARQSRRVGKSDCH